MSNTAQTRAPAAEFPRPLLLTPAQDWRGWLLGHAGRAALWSVTATSVVAVALIFVFIARQAWPFLRARGLGEALASRSWYPTSAPPVYGMLSLVYGSAVVTAGALLLAVPAGLLVASMLSDIVPFRVRQTVKPIVEILAAIPSVAYGFVAVAVLAPWLQGTLYPFLQRALPGLGGHLAMSSGTNALNAAVVLAVMALPTIVSVAEDALSAVGRELREASYACGATRAETLMKVVMPAARNGIMAAVVLGMMRAIGETMAVWMAAGNAAHIPQPWWDITQPVRTLTATIAGELGETPVGSRHRQALFAVGLILLVLSLGMNLVTEFLLGRTARAEGRRA